MSTKAKTTKAKTTKAKTTKAKTTKAKTTKAKTTKAKKRARAYSVFTMFSKAVFDHIGLSFSRSADNGKEGASNCDASCKLWEVCYASRMERIYKSLDSKLRRHFELGPVGVLVRAIADIKPVPIRWARISIDGSVPSIARMNKKTARAFVRLLREFIRAVQALGASVHLPVESLPKARDYREALEGTGVVVRRTDQSDTIEECLRSNDHRAFVVAKNGIHNGCVTKAEKQANIEYARECAQKARDAGQTCVDCPAISGSSLCGQCKACASPLVDLVIYAFHG
jgi:hypothetical protein